MLSVWVARTMIVSTVLAKWGEKFSEGSILTKSVVSRDKFFKFHIKVETFLEQIEVAFLSPSKICENLNFIREIQIFAYFAG